MEIRRRWSGQSQHAFYVTLGGRVREKVGGWEKHVVRGIEEVGRWEDETKSGNQ